MRRDTLALTTLCLGLGLAGCDTYDPQTREGVWQASHANRANLTLMAASPADLVRGTGTTVTDGQNSVAAVDRFHTDKVKKLPDSGISQISITGSGGNSSGGQ